MPTTKAKTVSKTTKAATKPVKTAKTGLTTAVYNLKAEKVGEVSLSPAIFATKWQPQLVSLMVRVYLSNVRSAHAKVKDRGEVAGTTKKMWAQKGTGRARHGSAKAGIFVGGGSVHGPQGTENFTLKLNQKTRKYIMNSLLSRFLSEESMAVIEDLNSISPKTKDACNFIDVLEKTNQALAKSKKIAIITNVTDTNVTRAFRNIPGFTILSLNSLNAYDLTKQNFLVWSRQAVESLK